MRRSLWKGGRDIQETRQVESLPPEYEEEPEEREERMQGQVEWEEKAQGQEEGELKEEQEQQEEETRSYEEFLEAASGFPELFSHEYTEEEYREWKTALWKLAESEIVFDRMNEDRWEKWRRIVSVDREKERYYMFTLDEDGMITLYDSDFDYEAEKLSAEKTVYSGSLNEQAHQAYEAFLEGKEQCYSREWDYSFSMKGTIAAWYLNDENAAHAGLLEEFLSYSVESQYLFVDFDGDGMDELFYYFLGGGMGYGDYLLIQYEEEKGLVSLYQCESGARWKINVYDNGVFVLDGSSGASVHGWDYYRILPEGEQEMLAVYNQDFQNDAEFICYIEPELSYKLENPHKGAETYGERSLKEEDFVEIDKATDTFCNKYCGKLLEWQNTVLDTHQR